MAHKKKQTSSRRNRSPTSSRVTLTKTPYESDGHYLLKLVLVILMGMLWLKFGAPLQIGTLPLIGLPIGMLAGLLIIHHFEALQQDRKIWYAILLVVTIICYFLPAGIMV